MKQNKSANLKTRGANEKIMAKVARFWPPAPFYHIH